MGKTINQKVVKKPKGNFCDICHNECGSLHTVFDSEYNIIKGLKQCISCLGGKKEIK